MKHILALLLGLLFASPTWAAVTVGNISSANTGASGTETGLTWSHNSNGDALFVGLSFYVWGGTNTYAESACTVTYNGFSMTKVEGGGHVSSDGLALEVWKLAAPTAGANNIVVTCAVAVIMHGSGLSASNVHQTTMTGDTDFLNSGFTSNPSATVASATGGLVFAVLIAGAPFTSCTPGTDETERWDAIISFDSSGHCGFTQAGAAIPVVIAPTINLTGDPNYRSLLAVAINEVAAAPPVARQRSVMILP